MRLVNQYMVDGYVGTLPEVKTVHDAKVANFRIAFHEGQGENKKTTWLTVVAWRELAETAAAHVKVGDLIRVYGKLSIRKYTDKQQVERTAVEVIASDFTFHSPKQEVAAAEAATTPEPENNHESHSEQYPGNAGVIPSVA